MTQRAQQATVAGLARTCDLTRIAPVLSAIVNLTSDHLKSGFVLVVLWLLWPGHLSESLNAATIVVPGTTEGDAREFCNRFPPGGARSQDLYPSSDFSALAGGPYTIVSLAYRPDITVDRPRSWEFDLELRLSTTQATPGAMSSTFSRNAGLDETVVYSGLVEFSTDGIPPGMDQPHTFDYVIELESPFTYDPRMGNLLVDLFFRPPSTGQVACFDSTASDADAVHTVAAVPASLVTANLQTSERIITQFEFVLEPSTSPGDCNGDGFVNVADLACVGTIDQRDAVLNSIGTLAGDLDGTGTVEFADFLILSANFGRDLPSYSDGNVNLQNGVDFEDFLILSANFGKTLGDVAPVPEPNMSFLAGLALLSSLTLRRRHTCSCQ